MFKKFIPLVILPVVLAAQPAEARRLFWWEVQGLDVYDPEYGANPYVADDIFNQREYDLYRKQMARRYRQAYYDDQFDDDPAFDYPVFERPLKPKVKKKKAAPKPVAETPVIYKPKITKPVAPKPKPVQQASVEKLVAPAKPPKLAGVTCEKGSGIVASFGFSNVSTKSCSGNTFTYGAERGGKPFEIQVSAASGELTAVKKL